MSSPAPSWGSEQGKTGFASLIRAYRRFARERNRAFFARHARWQLFARAVPVGMVGASLVASVAVNPFSSDVSRDFAAFLTLILGAALIDVGFLALGQTKWREDRDLTYVFVGLMFAAVPLWGLVLMLCVADTIRGEPISTSCTAGTEDWWVLLAWLLVLLMGAIGLDLRNFRRTWIPQNT